VVTILIPKTILPHLTVWVGDPGFEIRDPENHILDLGPDPEVEKTPDTESGSAILVLIHS
jgi:hypothetical protein